MTDKEKIEKLRSAVGLLMTYFGMEEDKWTKPIFDAVRAILKEVTND